MLSLNYDQFLKHQLVLKNFEEIYFVQLEILDQSLSKLIFILSCHKIDPAVIALMSFEEFFSMRTISEIKSIFSEILVPSIFIADLISIILSLLLNLIFLLLEFVSLIFKPVPLEKHLFVNLIVSLLCKPVSSKKVSLLKEIFR